jgi:hypothetical protein
MHTRTILGVAIVWALSLSPGHSEAQSRTVFSGIPVTKISEGGIDRVAENLPRSTAVHLACVISEINGKYYWASRGNKQVARYAAGSFVTYLAVDGAGYIRVIDPSAKAAASLMSETEASFDYVEHMLLGLRSVTYYGIGQ